MQYSKKSVNLWADFQQIKGSNVAMNNDYEIPNSKILL